MVYLANSTAPEPGRTVYVDLIGDGIFNPGEPSALTGSNGYYSIAGVTPGAFAVRVTSLPGDFFVDSAGKVAPAQTVGFTSGGNTTADFIFIQPTSPILPLSLLAAPFGASNPDDATAEVTGLYNIILGRAPDAPGLAGWASFLNAGTFTMAQEASLFLHSTEYESRAIASYYASFLRRTAAPSEVADWVSLTCRRATPRSKSAQLFLSSSEYGALHPTDADIIQSMYTNVLGRVGSAPEVAAWESYLHGGGSRLPRSTRAIVGLRDDGRAGLSTPAIFLGTPPYPDGQRRLPGRIPEWPDPGQCRRRLRQLRRLRPARQRDRHVRRWPLPTSRPSCETMTSP